MPNLKDIRSRIGSVKNTQQITRAMKMVSAAKLRRAQSNILNLRPYAQKLLGVISDIASTHRVDHPLLVGHNKINNVLIVVVTSDRGLCGGFNNNINRFALDYHQEHQGKYTKLDYIVIGKKAADFFRVRKIETKDVILNLAKEISFSMAAKVSERLLEAFTSGAYDSIVVIYNEFKSVISQKVVCEVMLPVDISKSTFESEQKTAGFAKDFVFEPDPKEIIDELLHRHFAVQIYRCLSESVAGEHGARMAAMESATKNAGDMIKGLTLTYNKLRQASITKELIEITSGAETLKN